MFRQKTSVVMVLSPFIFFTKRNKRMSEISLKMIYIKLKKYLIFDQFNTKYIIYM